MQIAGLFYKAQVLAMIAIDRESNRILSLVAEPIQSAEKGQTTEAQDALKRANSWFDEIRRADRHRWIFEIDFPRPQGADERLWQRILVHL